MDIDAIAVQVRQHGEALAKLDPEKLNNTIEQAFRAAMGEAQREFGDILAGMEEKIAEFGETLKAERETREVMVGELAARIVALEGYSRNEAAKVADEAKSEDPGPSDGDEGPAKKKKSK